MRLLLRFYPVDFRQDMGDAIVETYRDRCRAAARDGGLAALAVVWFAALADSARNGLGERARPAIRWRRSGNWGRDAERVVRRLVRAPLFAGSMIATLTVGLGAFAMVTAVVQKVLLAPLPYERPQDLYFVWRDYSTIFDLTRGSLAGTDVTALAANGGPIADVAAISTSRRTLTARAGETDAAPEEVALFVTTPNLFSILGVRPMLGRDFAPAETGPGRPGVMVLGHALWQRRFGGDRGAIGTEVMLNGFPYTIIGVLPPEVNFLRHGGMGPPESAEAYVTHVVDMATTNPGNGSYAGLLRARPGTTLESVNAAVGSVGRAVDQRDHAGRGIRLHAVSLVPDLVAGVRPALLVLAAAGVLLVLVLGVNMATLLLVRASERDREFAISNALGANRAALVRATLLEAVLLGAAGGACGALAAVWGTRALVALAPATLPRRETIAVDWPIALAIVGVGALLGLLAGTLPAGWATQARLSTLLRNAAVRGGGGGQGRMRRAMVVVQVALSVVLLSTGALVTRSFAHLLRAEPGFDAANVLTLRVPVPTARYQSDSAANALHERLQRELEAIPGVRSVGAVSALPLSRESNQTRVTFPGAPGNRGDDEHDAPLVDYFMTRPGYFETLGIRVVEGRAFGVSRTPGVREVVVDETLARHFFPTGSAVGARIGYGDDTLLVVGVARHARVYDVHRDGRFQLFVRNDDYTFHTLNWALRSERPAASLARDVRTAVHRIDPGLALAQVRPMTELEDDALRQPRLSAVLLAGFSLGALLLAAMGLYGVVAGSVNRRRHEMAVRLALGADHGGIVRLVLGEGARLVALGLLIGVPGIWAAGRLVDGVLVGVSAFDPATLLAVAAGLSAVAALACWVPARRVAGIQPAQSLREG